MEAATSSSASQDAKPAKPRRRRKAGRKKRRTECALERVVGVTSVHNASFAANPVTGDLAYPAGCVVVILSAAGEQTNYFRHTKAVSALTFSPDGRFLAVGERGRQPSVTVWDVQTGGAVVSLAGHRFGVACLAFSHDGRYVVTVGFQHDRQVRRRRRGRGRVAGARAREGEREGKRPAAFFHPFFDRHEGERGLEMEREREREREQVKV